MGACKKEARDHANPGSCSGFRDLSVAGLIHSLSEEKLAEYKDMVQDVGAQNCLSLTHCTILL